MSKSTLLKGAIWLTIATFLSKVLGSLFRIPLQNIAGDEVLGIFSVVYPVYMSILTVTVAGIPIAISKLISSARAEGRTEDIFFIHRTASILGLIFGLVGFLLMFGFANQIASALGGSLVTYSVIVVSFTLIFAPYMAVFRGFFQGFENMIPTAISQVLEQFVRVFVIIIAALYLTRQAFGVDLISGGIMVSSVIGVLFSLVYLLIVFAKEKKKLLPSERPAFSFPVFKRWSKKILVVSLPICFGALTMALLNVVDSLTVPRQLLSVGHSEIEVTGLYGIYGRGQALVQIAVVFASALILPLIPAITKALAEKNNKKASTMIEKGLTFTHLTSWPAAVGLAVLTIPLNFVLFGDVLGSDVIFVLSLSALFTAFSVLTTGVLQGMNKEREAAVIVVVFSVVKVILNIILVRHYGIIGAAISTLLVYVLINIANLWVLRRSIAFRLITRPQLVFAASSLVMGLVLVVANSFTEVETGSRLLAGGYVIGAIGLGGIIYVAIIVIGKGLDQETLSAIPGLSRFAKRKSNDERMS